MKCKVHNTEQPFVEVNVMIEIKCAFSIISYDRNKSCIEIFYNKWAAQKCVQKSCHARTLR